MKNDQVVGIGEALWDMLPEGRKIGGAPANFAYHMSQFGFEATAVSAVGRDPLGDGIVAEFDARGLHHDLARVEYPTGTVEVSLDAQGIPCYDIRTEVAWDHIPFTAGLQQLAARTRCICFGSLAQRNPDSRRTIQRFLDAMPETSLRVFDINLRQQFYGREVVEESLGRCNVLKINDEEIVILSRMFGLPTDMTEAGLALKRQYALQEVILTCGTRGSYVFHDPGHLVPPYAAGRGGRHGRGRRLVHGGVLRLAAAGLSDSRGPCPGGCRLGLCLLAARGHAPPPGGVAAGQGTGTRVSGTPEKQRAGTFRGSGPLPITAPAWRRVLPSGSAFSSAGPRHRRSRPRLRHP